MRAFVRDSHNDYAHGENASFPAYSISKRRVYVDLTWKGAFHHSSGGNGSHLAEEIGELPIFGATSSPRDTVTLRGDGTLFGHCLVGVEPQRKLESCAFSRERVEGHHHAARRDARNFTPRG